MAGAVALGSHTVTRAEVDAQHAEFLLTASVAVDPGPDFRALAVSPPKEGRQCKVRAEALLRPPPMGIRWTVKAGNVRERGIAARACTLEDTVRSAHIIVTVTPASLHLGTLMSISYWGKLGLKDVLAYWIAGDLPSVARKSCPTL